MAHRRAHLRELLDRVANLLVEKAPVGDDDDRVENLLIVLAQADELMRQPGDGVRLATAGGVLDEIPLSRATLRHVCQQLVHHVELVIARENLNLFLFSRLRVLLFDNLGVVLDNVRDALRRENPLPQVIGLQSVRVGWVARAVVPALVERQKPRALALELRAHPHLAVVHRQMHHATLKLEQLFSRVAVAPVLLDGVFYRLFGQAVLQFEGGNRQAVDEQAQVQRPPCFVQAVAQLPRDTEAIGRKQACRLVVVRRRRAVK